VYRRGDDPQLDLKRTPDGRIAIGLTAQGTRRAQYSFQLAHEFCHALRQNAGPRDRNTIIAIRLLPLFESEPRGWETLVFLNPPFCGPQRVACATPRRVALAVPRGPAPVFNRVGGGFRG